jgi:hypothetical protein
MVRNSTRQAGRLHLMMLALLLLMSSLFMTGRPSKVRAAAGGRALFILDGSTPCTAAVQTLKARDVSVQHVFPPNALIGQIPPTLPAGGLAPAGVVAVYRDAVNPDDLADYGPSAQKAGTAWNALLAAQTSEREGNALSVAQAGAELVYDAFPPPDLPEGQVQSVSETSAEPDYYHTSEFMIGTVAVGIILPESDGSIDPSTEDWSEEERQQVYTEIVAATDWWAAREPAAQLTFIYDDHYSQPVPTGYEPISRPQSDQYLWIGEVMGHLGYDRTTAYFTRVRDYVNDLRDIHGADWAFAFFVVDSSNDADNYFANGYFAYAYLGGPFSVMTYGNNGYGIHNMDAVAAHEMGHVFLALDQYNSARIGCDVRAGYLDVENQNSLYGSCASNESSIMRGQVWPYLSGDIDPYARGQVGWWDSDGDGVLDPVDTTTEISLTQEDLSPAGQTITYAGSVRDVPVVSARRPDATINRIIGVEYRLNGGDWRPTWPADGQFDAIEEGFTFEVSSLAPGLYQLDLLVRTALGGDRLIDEADHLMVSAPGSSAPVQQLDAYAPDPTHDNTPTYNGLAAAVSGTVAAVEFRVDGGDWQPAQAADGQFDASEEDFSFTVPALTSGPHTIEVRTTDSMGRAAVASSSDALEVLESHSVYLPAVLRNR